MKRRAAIGLVTAIVVLGVFVAGEFIRTRPGTPAIEAPPAPPALRVLVRALDGRAPGFSVAVARDGELVGSAGYGLADVEAGTRADGKTRYPVYSIAKTWTGVALARLAREGRLDPGGRIGDLADLDNPALADATILQLATHTAGVRHYAGEAEARGAHCKTVSEALPIFDEDPLVGPPGERHYSTWGFVLLSAAVEAVSGMSYPEYMRQVVFEPYGAANVVSAADAEPVPMYERGAEGAWVRSRADPSCKFGGGGFFATAEDVARIQSTGIADPDLVPEYKAMIYEMDDEGLSVSQGRSYGGAAAVATDVGSGWTVAVAMNANPPGLDLESLVRHAAVRLGDAPDLGDFATED